MFFFSSTTDPLITFDVWQSGKKKNADVLTSVQAPGQQVPLAGGALKVRRRAVYESAGLSGLSLRPSAVSKLGAHHQEALRRRLRGHQPEKTDTAVSEGTDLSAV